LFPDGSFAALWRSANGLHFSKGTPTGLSLTNLATGGDEPPTTWDAAIDDQGVAHVVFTGAGGMGPSVYYAELSATEATLETLIERNGYSNPALFLQVDATNTSHIISINNEDDSQYITGTRGALVSTPFSATSINPLYADLVRDASGNPVLLSFIWNGASYDLKAIGDDAGFSGEGTTLLTGVHLNRGFFAQQDADGTWYVVADRFLYAATSPIAAQWSIPVSSDIASFTIGPSGTIHTFGYLEGPDTSGEILHSEISGDSAVTKSLSPIVNTYYSTPIVMAK
jgi:hypothetical protein